MLIEDFKNFIKPLRAKRAEIAADLDFVKNVLEEGKAKAGRKAREKILEVKKAIGVL